MNPNLAIWQALDPDVVNNGIINLDAVFGGDHRVAYLVTNIAANKSKRVALCLGSDDGIKAWLNGRLIHANKATRPVAMDSDKVPVRLKKGDNILLLKVVEVTGRLGRLRSYRSPEETIARAARRRGKQLLHASLGRHHAPWREFAMSSAGRRPDARFRRTVSALENHVRFQT